MKLGTAARILPRVQRIGATSALVANLFATSMPLLHFWVHEVTETHARANLDIQSVESTAEVHPAELHDDCLRVPCIAFELSPAAVAGRYELGFVVPEYVKVQQAFLSAASRAPPTLEQARAPPIA